MQEHRAHEDELVHRALADRSRVRILRALQDSRNGLDAGQLAGAVGLHANTVRSHLRILEEAGLVTARRDAHGQQGRPHILFETVVEPRGAGSATDVAYRALAELLAQQLAADPDGVAKAEEAGRAWGLDAVRARPASEPIAGMMRLLEEMGFEPAVEATGAGQQVVMNACAFGPLSGEHDAVVCSAHLGLIRGALSGMGATLEATSLERQASTGPCVACIEPRDAA